jgi:hypothetical protein
MLEKVGKKAVEQLTEQIFKSNGFDLVSQFWTLAAPNDPKYFGSQNFSFLALNGWYGWTWVEMLSSEIFTLDKRFLLRFNH